MQQRDMLGILTLRKQVYEAALFMTAKKLQPAWLEIKSKLQ